jgi:hypothetical protein
MSTTKTRKPRIATHFKLVSIDETQYWSDEIVKEAGKIEQVYLFDESTCVNLCEITPSFRLIPLYFITENRVSDDTHESMMMEPSEETYVHCHQLQGDHIMDLRKFGLNFRYANSDSEHYRQGEERAVEYLQANHPI